MQRNTSPTDNSFRAGMMESRDPEIPGSRPFSQSRNPEIEALPIPRFPKRLKCLHNWYFGHFHCNLFPNVHVAMYTVTVCLAPVGPCSHTVSQHIHCVAARGFWMSDYLLTYLLTYLHTYTALLIIFHGNSNPGTNPGIPGFVFHNPEIPGLEKGSGIASPTRTVLQEFSHGEHFC